MSNNLVNDCGVLYIVLTFDWEYMTWKAAT